MAEMRKEGSWTRLCSMRNAHWSLVRFKTLVHSNLDVDSAKIVSCMVSFLLRLHNQCKTFLPKSPLSKQAFDSNVWLDWLC